MILVIATPEEARELLGHSTRQTEILRPQTSGPCVHYDEMSEYVADAYPCTYPYGDGVCPHLDNPDVLCPVKDACSAMHAEPAKTCANEDVRGVSDPLNDILVECCKLRGCYPLMHRTLHEFNWFCNCAISGAGPFIDGEIEQAEADGNEALAGALNDRRNEENWIRDRFNDRYKHGSDELIRFAEAYREWCREQYGNEEGGA